MENLAETLKDDSFLSFNSDCVRKRSNWSRPSKIYKFDGRSFDKTATLKDIPSHSPKLHALLKKIEALDEEDMKNDGVLYKHFIFCDLKSGTFGAKILAAALIASGYRLGYWAEGFSEDSDSESDSDSSDSDSDNDDNSINGGGKAKAKIQFLSDSKLKETKSKNFYLLSSVNVYNQPITVANKKRILQKFNERPGNIHGEQVRFIIMDSGFKEGIDLFDIKYVHIFEPPVNTADQKQVIGRGTRTCGQKGLTFHPTKGWSLHVMIYDIEIPGLMRPAFLETPTAFDLFLKSLNLDLRLFTFAEDLEKIAIYGSVDFELNKNIHNFSVSSGGTKASKKKIPRLVVDRSLPPLIINTKQSDLGELIMGDVSKTMTFQEMRDYISHSFGDLAWEPAKIENLCGTVEKPSSKSRSLVTIPLDAPLSKASLKDTGVSSKTSLGGASSDLIKYTPTQEFVARYFTPQAPVKGLLLWHSVGTGKTCSAIAAATASFEPQQYTILWVTRTTLKNDIWKNMFDQICNETIRRRIVTENLTIPSAQPQRMKLLAKSWKIRPMSYKQFSNLVSKENDFYKRLVQTNGDVDPLRKTLLIIDEAHKLYGGGDLSSIERPDMVALHKAIMNSYSVSGNDSVRLLLMTATPITENPMELIKIINLCKPADQQLPDDFITFSNRYLDETGEFNVSGRSAFLDQIAGNVSYLNREKDARQFAQVYIKYIRVPLIKDVQDAMSLDRKLVKSVYGEEINALKSKIRAEIDKIDDDLKSVTAKQFASLKDVCEKFDGRDNKKCIKIANAEIKELVKEAKEFTAQIKDDIKKIREEIKNKNLFKKDVLSKISERVSENPEELDEFKKSAYYMLKYKCGKRLRPDSKFKEISETNPDIIRINQELDAFDARIGQLEQGLKSKVDAHNARIKRIKSMMRRSDTNDLERSVLKMTLADIRKTYKVTSKTGSKEAKAEINNLSKTRKNIMRQKKKALSNLKKSMKKQLRAEKKAANATKKAEAKLRKIQRKEEQLQGEFKNNVLKGLVDKYSKKIDAELEGIV
jgi:hypothetical protein